MKKIYVSLVSFAFMFNGCGNNELDNNNSNSNNNEIVNKSSKIISQSMISKRLFFKNC